MASSARGALEGARGSETCAACLDLDFTMESHAAHPATASRNPPRPSERLGRNVAVDAPTPKTGFGRPRFSSDCKSSLPRSGDEPHREPGLASGHIDFDKEFHPRYARAAKIRRLRPAPTAPVPPPFSAERPEELASFPGASTGFWSQCHRRSSVRLLNSQ